MSWYLIPFLAALALKDKLYERNGNRLREPVKNVLADFVR